MDNYRAENGGQMMYGIMVWHSEDDEGFSLFWWNTSNAMRWEYSHGELKCGLRTPPIVEMVEVDEAPCFGLKEAVCFSIGAEWTCMKLGKWPAKL